MTDISDKDRFLKVCDKYHNPKLKLLKALIKVSDENNKENVLEVARTAAKAEDYVTATYWFEKIHRYKYDLDSEFESISYSNLAQIQLKYNPDTQPIKSYNDMLLHSTSIAHKLSDRSYITTHCLFRMKQCEIYREEFAKIDFNNIHLENKPEKEGCLSAVCSNGCLLRILVYGIASCFMFFLSQCFGMYSVISCAILLVIGMIITNIVIYIKRSKEMSNWNQNDEYEYSINEFDEKVDEYVYKSKDEIIAELKSYADIAKTKVEDTNEYKEFVRINNGIPEKLCNYDSRLVLAALSVIYNEENVNNLVDLVDNTDHNKWVMEFADKEKSVCQNSNIINNSTADESDLNELLLRYVIYRKNVSTTENADDDIFVSIDEIILSVDGSDRGSKNESQDICKVLYIYLKDKYNYAIENENDVFLGEVCYLLYLLLTVYKTEDSEDMMYNVINKGMLLNPKLKFLVMKEVISDPENMQKNYGYDLYDVNNCIEELKCNGDPLGYEIQDMLRYSREKSYEDDTSIFDEDLLP